ncbi:unnamed protein product [Lepidochelys kempii]
MLGGGFRPGATIAPDCGNQRSQGPDWRPATYSQSVGVRVPGSYLCQGTRNPNDIWTTASGNPCHVEWRKLPLPPLKAPINSKSAASLTGWTGVTTKEPGAFKHRQTRRFLKYTQKSIEVW